jgi:response regulator of citrate/malate metabolism
MAERGKPLSFTVREQIKTARQQGATVRTAAQSAGVSKTTAQKYGRNSLVQSNGRGTPNL